MIDRGSDIVVRVISDRLQALAELVERSNVDELRELISFEELRRGLIIPQEKRRGEYRLMEFETDYEDKLFGLVFAVRPQRTIYHYTRLDFAFSIISSGRIRLVT